MSESSLEKWVTFKVSLEDCYCGKINMSGNTASVSSSIGSRPESIASSPRTPLAASEGREIPVRTPRTKRAGSETKEYPAGNSRAQRAVSESKEGTPKKKTDSQGDRGTPKAGPSSSTPVQEGSRQTPLRPIKTKKGPTPSGTPKTPKAPVPINSEPSCSSGGSGSTKRRARPKKSTNQFFEPYFSLADVQRGLEKGELIEGVLRINPKSYEDAYISAPSGGPDVYIGGIRDRNRALNGDVVIVQPKPQNEWKIIKENVLNHIARYPEEKDLFGLTKVPEPPPVEPLKVTPNEATVVLCALSSELPGESVVIPVKDSEETVDNVEQRIMKDTQKVNSRKFNSADGNIKPVCVAPHELEEDLSGESDTNSVEDYEAELEFVEDFDNLKIVDKSLKKNLKKVDAKFKTEGKQGKNEGKGEIKKKMPFEYIKRKPEEMDFDLELISKHPESGKFIQKTGKVVYILEIKHSRCAVGHLRKCAEGAEEAKRYAFFVPTDGRVPRMHIPLSECPVDLLRRPGDYSKVLFIAKIFKWTMIKSAIGSIVRSLGSEDNVDVLTIGMLIENDVPFDDFEEDVLKCLPETPWKIPEEEFAYRKDFRNQCVFTIDPSTARDLDDAVSCIPLGDDRYRIGVHIADVSFFVKENTPLDSAASHRGTSVYLVQKVVPMLPRLLCEQLCSLNPGEDRLAFSVEWVVNGEGDIEEEWFGRSVIKSCAKLAYEHAQSIIENPGKNDWAQNELPEIQKPFTIHDVCGVVTNLQKIACSLRQRRHAYGALRLDLPRIGWTLDRETGMPTGFRIYQLKDSNRLIEELMLLANMAVARKIYTTFPDVTLLRCHPPPQELMLQEVAQCLASIGIHVDTSSSGSLQNSLHRYYGVRSELPKLNPDDEDWAAVGRAIVMTNLIAKPMVVAKYISAGVKKEPSEFRHYALAVPLYTHFTSPIRRYPDLIVHRLLASSLGYCEKPRWDAKSLHKVAERCNDRKATAKMVGDLSSEMFLGLFIKTVGSIATRGVVLQVLDRSVDVVLLNSGLIKRVYMDKLPLKKLTHESQCGIGTLTLVWDNGPNLTDLVQVLTIFSMVEVRLEEGESALKFSAILVKPETLE